MTDRIDDETELIQTYLAPLAAGAPGAFGLSDDTALISPEPGSDLVISTDPIIAGVHFFSSDRADDIAWKALAVNVSDLVAKGAEPLCYTMALAFPDAPERSWMANFSEGLRIAQTAFGCHLIGGDTDRTPGPLSIGITAIGVLPHNSMVVRRGARVGDHVFVTGTLGDSAIGLALHRDAGLYDGALTAEDRNFLIGRYLRPNPRLVMTAVLRAYASAALDVSDGFLKDAARLANGAGLTVMLADLPLSPPAQAALTADKGCIEAVLSGGDDYEILFAVPPARLATFREAAAATGVATTELGVLRAEPGIAVIDESGLALPLGRLGYDHFRLP